MNDKADPSIPGIMAVIEAEQALIGALLLDNRTYDRVAHVVQPGHFLDPQCRAIAHELWRTLGAGKQADVITVAQALGEQVSAAELHQLAQYVPSAANAARYAQMIYERSKDRELGAAALRIGELAGQSERPIAERLDQAQSALEAIVERRADDDWTAAADSVSAHLQTLQDRLEGRTNAMPTGLADLDDRLNGGLRPGQLVIIGARPSMGKTALGLTLAVNMARDYVVGFLSMEMSQTELNDRIVAMVGRVSIAHVQRPAMAQDQDRFWYGVTKAADAARTLNLHVSDRSGLTIHQIRSKARHLRRVHGLHVLVVDYIGLTNGTDPRAMRTYQLEEVSRGLKELSKELGICIVCLAQVGREVEKRAEQTPSLSDLKDSGAIEQDADAVMFIHRPHQVRPDIGPEWSSYAKLVIAKQRNGPTGALHMQYIGNQTRFDNWQGDAPQSRSLPGRGGFE